MMPDSAPEAYRFCPHCATPLITRPVSDKPRRVCPACDFIYFTDPKVGVGVLVIHEEKVLLIRRAMRPHIGLWSLPAGFLDRGEDPQATAERETAEETGLEVRITSLIDVFYNGPSAQGGASVFILYRAEWVSGVLAAGDDADAVEFFALDALPELAFASTIHAVALAHRETSID
jgi:ADP-ribose pyrophosphatase YjhB (NUDIX family)